MWSPSGVMSEKEHAWRLSNWSTGDAWLMGYFPKLYYASRGRLRFHCCPFLGIADATGALSQVRALVSDGGKDGKGMKEQPGPATRYHSWCNKLPVAAMETSCCMASTTNSGQAWEKLYSLAVSHSMPQCFKTIHSELEDCGYKVYAAIQIFQIPWCL